MRIFADTNVLFDIFAQREPFVESSYKLMIMQMFGDVEVWAAPQSFLDIFYVLKRVQPAAEVQAALAAGLERINVCATGHEDVRAALQCGWEDAEDALIARSCESVAANYLLTRDAKQDGFKRLGIPALAPEEFFALVERERGISYADVALDL